MIILRLNLKKKFYEDYSRVVFNTLYNKDTDFPHKPWAGDDVIFDPQFIPQYLFTHNESGDKLVDTIGFVLKTMQKMQR